MKELILRANYKWMENSKNHAKYFLIPEKRNCINKNISRPVGDNGQEITDQRLNIQEN